MRVATAFKRLLRLPGASVVDVCFGAEGIVVTVRLRRRRRVCALCGQTGGQLEIHDRRRKRWRHLDLGASRCVIECELRRLRCPDCHVVRLEPVPWARPGSPYTRDFEDVVAWLAQQMAKTPIAALLRIGWDSVGRIVERVMADRLDARRLHGLVAIGIDEISYRRGQRYLTSVADHATGAIVWCAPGRNSATLQGFFAELGERRHSIRAVSIDMSGEYQRAIHAAIPHAEICFDPFHVCRLASRATDQVRRDDGTPTSARTPRPAAGSRAPAGRCSKRPNARPSASWPPSARSNRPTPGSTAPSCCAKSSGCSTTSTTDASHPPTSTPGWPGPPDPGSPRSSSSPAPSAPTATASSPPSASASPTAASRASTARSASSATAASASTPPPP